MHTLAKRLWWIDALRCFLPLLVATLGLAASATHAATFRAPQNFLIMGVPEENSICWTGSVPITAVGDFDGPRWKVPFEAPAPRGCFQLRGNGRFNLYDNADRALLITPNPGGDGLDSRMGKNICRACDDSRGCALKLVPNREADADCNTVVPFSGPSRFNEADVRAAPVQNR